MDDPFAMYEYLRNEILYLIQYFYGFKISVKKMYYEDKIQITSAIKCKRCGDKIVYKKMFQSKNVFGIHLRNFALTFMLRDFFRIPEEDFNKLNDSILVKCDFSNEDIMNCVRK